ncbi:hypothetical protein GQ600_10096 [Phytophthora cactorum]|nr:hypothetical protein GQ600_10096 [Phytophthora cactorum]
MASVSQRRTQSITWHSRHSGYQCKTLEDRRAETFAAVASHAGQLLWRQRNYTSTSAFNLCSNAAAYGSACVRPGINPTSRFTRRLAGELWIVDSNCSDGGYFTHAIVVQMTYLIDDLTVSVSQMLQLYVLVPSIVVGLAMVVTEYLVFPIPFFVLLAMPMFFFLLVISLRVVLGSRAYEMFFHASQGTKYQVLVILLLPVIKVAAKNVVLHFAKSLEDMVPVEVIFTADFFNAVYVATCMQNATSATAISAITITDISQTIVMLYKLQRRTTNFVETSQDTG